MLPPCEGCENWLQLLRGEVLPPGDVCAALFEFALVEFVLDPAPILDAWPTERWGNCAPPGRVVLFCTEDGRELPYWPGDAVPLLAAPLFPLEGVPALGLPPPAFVIPRDSAPPE